VSERLAVRRLIIANLGLITHVCILLLDFFSGKKIAA
jgi:hypothetical protein